MGIICVHLTLSVVVVISGPKARSGPEEEEGRGQEEARHQEEDHQEEDSEEGQLINQPRHFIFVVQCMSANL